MNKTTIERFYNLFTTKTRPQSGQQANGNTDEIVIIKDELDKTPEAEAIRKLIFDFNDNIGLLDQLYAGVYNILGSMQEYDELTEDGLTEIADGLVDVYNSDRADWLAHSHANAEYVDEATIEFGVKDPQGIYASIGAGQYKFYFDLAQAIYNLLEAQDEE